MILADEPTGSLDADNSAAVIDLLLAAQRETGATLVVVTHDPEVAAAAGPHRRAFATGGSRGRSRRAVLSYVWRDLVRNPRRTLASLVGVRSASVCSPASSSSSTARARR